MGQVYLKQPVESGLKARSEGKKRTVQDVRKDSGYRPDFYYYPASRF